MQGRSDQHITRSRHRLMALSILTFAAAMLAAQVSSTRAASVSSFKVAKLVGSKGSGGKRNDSHMINAWGLAFIAADGGSPFWINDEATGVSELIDGKGKIFKALPFVTIPGQRRHGKPTGIVGNATGLFAIPGSTSALFIFATEEGRSRDGMRVRRHRNDDTHQLGRGCTPGWRWSAMAPPTCSMPPIPRGRSTYSTPTSIRLPPPADFQIRLFQPDSPRTISRPSTAICMLPTRWGRRRSARSTSSIPRAT